MGTVKTPVSVKKVAEFEKVVERFLSHVEATLNVLELHYTTSALPLNEASKEQL